MRSELPKVKRIILSLVSFDCRFSKAIADDGAFLSQKYGETKRDIFDVLLNLTR